MKLLNPGKFAAMAASVAALCGFAVPVRVQYSRYDDPYRTMVVASPSPYWGCTDFTAHGAVTKLGMTQGRNRLKRLFQVV